MSHRVNGQKYVLNGIVDIAGVLESPCCQRAQIRGDSFKECTIGIPIAVLRAAHELGPVAMAGAVPPLRCSVDHPCS
jgi:hypothetical protein